MVEPTENWRFLHLSYIEWTLEEQTIQKYYHFGNPSHFPARFADPETLVVGLGEILFRDGTETCVLPEEDARQKCRTLPDPKPVYKPGETVFWLGSRKSPEKQSFGSVAEKRPEKQSTGSVAEKKPGETVFWLGGKVEAGTDTQEWKNREPSIDPFVVTQANYYPGDAGGFWLYFCHGNVEEEPNRNFHDAHIGRLVFSTYDEAEKGSKNCSKRE